MVFALGWPGCRSALILTFLSLNYKKTSAKVHYGFQSDNIPDVEGANSTSDDSFASSMYYDPRDGLVYVTGSTYSRFWGGIERSSSERDKPLAKSDCFLTILKLPDDVKDRKNGGVDREMKMVYARRFGKEGTAETCSDIMYMPSVSKTVRAITVGNTVEGGMLTSMRSPGSRRASHYGFMMDFNIDLAKKKGIVNGASGKVHGGKLINDYTIQHPIAMTSDPLATQAKKIYVALLASPITSKDMPVLNPDLASMKDHVRDGHDFRVVIEMKESKSKAISDYEAEKFESLEEGGVKETIVSGWKRSFSPNNPSESNAVPTSLQVSDLVYVPRTFNGSRDDVLVLTGTTNGYGPGVGGPKADVSPSNYGFITKLSPFDGTIETAKDKDIIATTRIGTENSNDSIYGVCFQNGIVDVEHIYVVGHTMGLLGSGVKAHQLSVNMSGEVSKHAFVTKLNLRTLEREWSKQVGSRDGEDIIGQGCDVSPDGSTVYLAGTVKDGGSINNLDSVDGIDDGSESAGGDDLFVASYSEDGTAIFIRQFGTAEDDTFAGGKGIVCDESGNAIVLGNTRGSMMRLREEDETKYNGRHPSDIFVMSIGKQKGKTPAIAEIAPDEYLTDARADDETRTELKRMSTQPKLHAFEIIAITVASVILLVVAVYAGILVKNSSGTVQVKSMINSFAMSSRSLGHDEPYTNNHYTSRYNRHAPPTIDEGANSNEEYTSEY